MPAYGVSNGVHPDHHAWWIHPNNGDFMIDGNDGGLNITHDGGKTWRFVKYTSSTVLPQSVDNEIPYNIYGECKTMALGEDQPTPGEYRAYAILTGKKLPLAMDLT